MHNFKELKVWQKSIELAVDVYEACVTLPIDERFGMISQMKRCSISIPSNIAEGSGRGSNPQLKHFLSISQGSAFELETQIIISQRLGLLSDALANGLVEKVSEVQKMIYSLERKL